jgi:hypothetical protein
MADERASDRPGTPACRWRASSETLDVIEALERIEALLLRLDQRLARTDALTPKPETSPIPDALRVSDARL